MTRSRGRTDYATAPAEYRWDQDRTWPRVLFLRAIQEHADEVLAALREDVLPSYRPHHPSTKKGLEELRWSDELQQEVMSGIWPEVMKWADQFNLRGPGPTTSDRPDAFSLLGWMENIIVCTLVAWESDPDRPLKWGFLPEASVHAHMVCPRSCLFETDEWVLQRENEAAFKERIREKFEVWLRDYIKERRAQADDQQSSGLLPAPSRLATNHFAYLTLYQCLKRSHGQIREDFDCTCSSVGEGIRIAAEAVIGDAYVAWLRPPSPPGRPRSK